VLSCNTNIVYLIAAWRRHCRLWEHEDTTRTSWQLATCIFM